MNIRTYSFTKYIATIGSFLLFIAPLLGFLEAWSYVDLFKGNYTVLWIVSVILEVLGIIAIVTYILLRNKLKNKSGYEYTKEDNKKLFWSFAMYGATIILSFVYVIIAASIQDNDKTVMIIFAPLYILQFGATIGAAIFESMSRIQEQVYLYKVQEEVKEKDPVKVSKTGTKRTNEAQEILSKSKRKAKDKKVIEDKDDLEDFLNNEDNDK